MSIDCPTKGDVYIENTYGLYRLCYLGNYIKNNKDLDIFEIKYFDSNNNGWASVDYICNSRNMIYLGKLAPRYKRIFGIYILTSNG